MGVWVLPNANTVDVIGRVNREVQQIRGELPTGMVVGVAYDSTKYIKSAIKEVVTTLSRRLILIVMVVIFLFLGSLRTVLVPVVAIPGVAHRRRILDAGIRLYGEPAHPCWPLFFLSVWWWTTRSSWWKTASVTCARVGRGWRRPSSARASWCARSLP